MERRDTITDFEFENIPSDILHDSGHVVARVEARFRKGRLLPVFRVAARTHDLDKDLGCCRPGNRDIMVYLDRQIRCDDGFFHVGHF